jgi:hypothetical protein
MANNVPDRDLIRAAGVVVHGPSLVQAPKDPLRCRSIAQSFTRAVGVPTFWILILRP